MSRSLPVLFLLATAVHAQTSFPMVTHVTPVAVQRGTSVEATVEGQMNFAGATSVLFDRPGLSATIVPDPKAKPDAPIRAVKLKIAADADAEPGVREFRVVSTLGVSSVGQILVVDNPVVAETANNNAIATATPLPVPGVASGRVETLEDVDFYKVHAVAGRTLTLEVVGARLQDKIHDLQKHLDPIVTVFDAKGRELAANDDYVFADPYLAFRVPATGDYYIQVRDSKYDGDPRWAYALCVTDRPHVAHALPFAGKPGEEMTVETVGSVGKATVRLPTEPGLRDIRLKVGDELTNPLAFVVSTLSQATEREPNDTPAQAQRVVVPCGINGRVGKPTDLDHYAFAAIKGKPIRFEVKARRFGTNLQSSLDSVLDVLDAKGAVLASNDDDPTTGKDSVLTFAPPADGDFVLRVRDLNSKGGPSFVYHVEADFAKPDFALRCDGSKAMIGPGSRTAWYVHATRTNGFAGPINVVVEGLPAGLTVNPLTIPSTMTQGLLVVSGAKDATVGAAANVRVVGTSDGVGSRLAAASEEIYMPGGGRGRFDVNSHTVAVTAPSDILDVVVAPSSATLRRGQEITLDVVVSRRADYKGPVTLDVALRHLEQYFSNPLPPGITIVDGKSKTLLSATESKGRIVLKASADAAPISDVPISVVANVSINFVVKVGYSSAVVPLTISGP